MFYAETERRRLLLPLKRPARAKIGSFSRRATHIRRYEALSRRHKPASRRKPTKAHRRWIISEPRRKLRPLPLEPECQPIPNVSPEKDTVISRAGFLLSQLSLAARLPGKLHSVRSKDVTLRIGAGLDGCLSEAWGFMSPPSIRVHLPPPFQTWESVHASLPILLRLGRARTEIDSLPVLDCAWEVLDQRYLGRAALVLSALAHAFYFGFRDEKVKPDLPAHLMQAWTLVSRRLGRAFPGRVVADDVLNNADPEDTSVPFSLSSTYFNLPEERLASGLQGAMEHTFAPALYLMASAQSLTKADRPVELARCLEAITAIIVDCAHIFQVLSPRSVDFDPVQWIKTYPAMGSPVVPGELGNSGVDAPLFHALDAFISRAQIAGDLRGMQTDRFNTFPASIRAFIEALKCPSVRVRDYVGQKPNEKRLNAAFDGLLQMYLWFLEKHRVKAVGITGVSLASGRHTTSSGVGSERGHAKAGPSLPPDALLSRQMKAGMLSRLGERPIWLTGTVQRCIQGEAIDVIEVGLDGVLPLQAGDRVQIWPGKDENVKPRYYSVGDVSNPGQTCSEADDPKPAMIFSLHVGRCPGVGSIFMQKLEPGMSFRLRASPSPRFRQPADYTLPLVLIGQGSGVGPFLGFLRQRQRCKRAGTTGKVLFFVAARRSGQLPCTMDELVKLSAELPLTVVLAFGDEQHLCIQGGQVIRPEIWRPGRVLPHLLRHRQTIQDLVLNHDAHIFVCGSADFGITVRRTLGLQPSPSNQSSTARAHIPAPIPHWGHYHEDLFGVRRSSSASTPRRITPSELAQHNTFSSCWTCISGTVYDVTSFLTLHPGGAKTLIESAGKVADRRFYETHGGPHLQEIEGQMAPYAIGVLEEHATEGRCATVTRWLEALVDVQNALTNNSAFAHERGTIGFQIYSDSLIVFSESGLDKIVHATAADDEWEMVRKSIATAQAELSNALVRLKEDCRASLANATETTLQEVEGRVAERYAAPRTRLHGLIDGCKVGLSAFLTGHEQSDNTLGAIMLAFCEGLAHVATKTL